MLLCLKNAYFPIYLIPQIGAYAKSKDSQQPHIISRFQRYMIPLYTTFTPIGKEPGMTHKKTAIQNISYSFETPQDYSCFLYNQQRSAQK